MWRLSLDPTFNGHPFLLILQKSDDGGKEVHVSFDFPDSSNYQLWAFIRVDIGTTKGTYDLSSVDSIAFDAWGSGNAEIQIVDESRTDMTTGYGLTIGKYPITLPEKKTKLQFAFADLVPKEEDRKRVTSISIVFHDDAELHFDNIEFIGKDLLNIWKTKE